MFKHFGKVEFWDERYASTKDSRFEWYARLSDFKTEILDYIKPHFNILDVGCGNSNLFEEVFAIGVQKIKCIDNSFALISHLKKKHETTYGAHVEFICCDARKMHEVFKEPCFDTIFDKGTFDCILAGDVSMNHVSRYFEELNRVLTNNGAYIMLSCMPEDFLQKYFKKVNWKVKVLEVNKIDFEQKPLKKGQLPPKNCYYLYICTKAFKTLGDTQDQPEENNDVIE